MCKGSVKLSLAAYQPQLSTGQMHFLLPNQQGQSTEREKVSLQIRRLAHPKLTWLFQPCLWPLKAPGCMWVTVVKPLFSPPMPVNSTRHQVYSQWNEVSQFCRWYGTVYVYMCVSMCVSMCRSSTLRHSVSPMKRIYRYLLSLTTALNI